ncbi:patatin-related protein [Nitrospirillum amazonense]|uniref:Patatin-related protein n=1 Tax=Nitrospirillum amazonense TaxID=28077 RepID=A0A560FLT8_9PROT|nr:patatin-like protein [Nitrospirillum amazonense]TWB22545.1 patatin-related protein [Nitrospirillum amazonense]
MKEKELRMALVCYGGVSLAVYMHGVTKELLKLARASRVFHGTHDPRLRNTGSYQALQDDLARRIGYSSGASLDGGAQTPDTEEVYVALLQEVGAHIDLRIVIDVIAGSSAGGINGVLLARALAHDLDLDALTELWLDGADVTNLMVEDGRATKWSKWFLKPFLAYGLGRLMRLAPDDEMRWKLSMFVRSRWFKPPFDGMRLMEMLLDAASSMGRPVSPYASLLPAGQSLSLFVTVTDFHGFLQRIPAHDPPTVEEREHRHVLKFHYRRWPGGRVDTDFGEGAIPGLVFAARATSSFPGAFTPAHLRALDGLLARRGRGWPERERFLKRNFRRYTAAGVDPGRISFIDGSVLNNKPFAEALRAISGRPAYREVDRRLIYIDPDPAHLKRVAKAETPGFFRTLKGALSDIPRNEPVRDELVSIDRNNARVRQLRSVIDAARPGITQLVHEVVGGEPPAELTYAQIHDWREIANGRAAQEAGFAYEAYVRLKLTSVLDAMGRLVAVGCGYQPGTAAARQATEALHAWARATGITPDQVTTWSLERRGDGLPGGDAPPWVRFLLAFDVGFRGRRLRFVIRALNELYSRLDEDEFADVAARDLDEIKANLYDCLERLRVYESGAFLNADEREALAVPFVEPLAMGRQPDVAAVDQVMWDLARRIDLNAINQQVDEIFALMGLNMLGVAARRELFVAYVGFAFWDVLTFSISGWRELDDLEEVRVDRISPDDARFCQAMGGAIPLKGREINHFGAFFSRVHRESDYLMGRLHAADRLVDLVLDAAGHPPGVDGPGLKRRLFAAIARTERQRLGDKSPALRWLETMLAEGAYPA